MFRLQGEIWSHFEQAAALPPVAMVICLRCVIFILSVLRFASIQSWEYGNIRAYFPGVSLFLGHSVAFLNEVQYTNLERRANERVAVRESQPRKPVTLSLASQTWRWLSSSSYSAGLWFASQFLMLVATLGLLLSTLSWKWSQGHNGTRASSSIHPYFLFPVIRCYSLFFCPVSKSLILGWHVFPKLLWLLMWLAT